MGIYQKLDKIIPPIHYDHKTLKLRDFIFGTIGFIGFMIIIGAITFPLRLLLMNTPYYIRFLDIILTCIILGFEIFLILYLLKRRKWVSIGAIMMFIFTILLLGTHIYILINYNLTLLPTYNSLDNNIFAYWLV